MGGLSSMETHMKKVALIVVLVGLALGGCSSFDNSAPKGVPDSKLWRRITRRQTRYCRLIVSRIHYRHAARAAWAITTGN
jgi:hypothetical protein